MTWFLAPATAGDLPYPEATQRPSSAGERLRAAIDAQRIEDDSWNRLAGIEERYLRELEGELSEFHEPAPVAGHGISVGPVGAIGLPLDQSLAPRRKAVLAAAARARAAAPESWPDLPVDENDLIRRIRERQQAEYDDARKVLEGGPGDAFAVEFLGRAWAGLTDEASLATLGFGAGGRSLARIVAAEAGLGAASEAVIAPRRQQVARELDVPEPNVLMDIAMAGLTAGAFAGSLGLIVEGARRASQLFRARGEGTAVARPQDASPGQHETRVEDAATALAEDRGLLPAIAADAPENWQAIRGGIFAGESQGDFDALFGFSNRPGGAWANVRLTEMTVDQAIEFAHPRGPYAQWVKARVGRVSTPMGAYQIVGSTLREVKRGLGLRGDELMVPELQERMGQWIYRSQGTGAWEGYRGPRPDFVPGDQVAAPAGGAWRPTSRGYTGEGQMAVGGRHIDVEFVVVDAAILRRAEGRFQPRDRSRINSDAWIAETAARLDPVQLMPSPTADRGAPLVGPDNMIESGNGRFGAIMRAYDQHPDRAAAYRAQIEAAGFEVPAGVERPVLIARRRTELDDAAREQMTVDAQDSGVARMTPTEIARTSARAMTADRLAAFDPAAGIRGDRNRGFLQSVLSALPRSERNALFDDAGVLNAEGRRRMAHAFFARAWDDGGPLGRDALMRYAEIEDAGDLKSLMDALESAAPVWATLRAEIEAGQVRPEFDITAHVLDALHVIVLARREAGRAGGSIADAIEAILGQGDLFAGPNPLSVALLRRFWQNGRAAPAAEIAGFLQRYAAEARTAGRNDLFADAPAPPKDAAGVDALRARWPDLALDPDNPGFVDTRGKGVRFHGAARPIDGPLLEDSYSSLNYYGQGFYATDALAIANGYSRKGKSTSGRIYRISEREPVVALDMEQPVPEWLREAMTDDDLVTEALGEAPANLRELYDLMRELSRGWDMSADEVQIRFDAFAGVIRDHGYNALDHRGGLRTGRAAHDVRIYLEPKRSVGIDPVDPANPLGRQGGVAPVSGHVEPADVLRRLDPETFGDLPDDIPPVIPADPPPVDGPDLPETAFARGADSPEAEMADAQAVEDLRGAVSVSVILEGVPPEGYVHALAARQPFDDLDGLYQHAEIAQARLAAAGERIAQDLPVTWKNPGLKAREMAAEKLVRKGYDLPREMTDVSRGGFVVKDMADANQIITRLRETFDLVDEGWIATETGYIDRKLILRHPDGMLSEVQIWTEAMLAAKQTGTPFYTRRRSLRRTDPEWRELFDREVVLYSAASAGMKDATLASVGTSALPIYHPKRARSTSSEGSADSNPAVWDTSSASTGTQGPPGLSMASAKNPPRGSSNSAAGRWSQLEYDRNFMGGDPSVDTPKVGSVDAGVNAADAARLRADADALGDFELPDGRRASDLLNDIEDDETLQAVIDACTLGGKPQ